MTCESELICGLSPDGKLISSNRELDKAVTVSQPALPSFNCLDIDLNCSKKYQTNIHDKVPDEREKYIFEDSDLFMMSLSYMDFNLFDFCLGLIEK